jgi:hypothetical protein
MADKITYFLRQDGFAALGIHGDKKQQERYWVMKEFKEGKSPILIATDVAARGLGMYPHPSLLCAFLLISRVSLVHDRRHIDACSRLLLPASLHACVLASRCLLQASPSR